MRKKTPDSKRSKVSKKQVSSCYYVSSFVQVGYNVELIVLVRFSLFSLHHEFSILSFILGFIHSVTLLLFIHSVTLSL